MSTELEALRKLVEAYNCLKQYQQTGASPHANPYKDYEAATHATNFPAILSRMERLEAVAKAAKRDSEQSFAYASWWRTRKALTELEAK